MKKKNTTTASASAAPSGDSARASAEILKQLEVILPGPPGDQRPRQQERLLRFDAEAWRAERARLFNQLMYEFAEDKDFLIQMIQERPDYYFTVEGLERIIQAYRALDDLIVARVGKPGVDENSPVIVEALERIQRRSSNRPGDTTTTTRTTHRRRNPQKYQT